MKHLTVEQRYKLEILLQKNVCKTQIAVDLNIHISLIYKQLQCNSE
jgi:IS30 family transposase